jgi:outer membrane lipoprotein-sorting protein
MLAWVLILACCFISFVHAGKQTPVIPNGAIAEDQISAKSIMQRMIAETEALRTLTFDLKIQERGAGKFRNSISYIKIQRNPRKVYMKLNGPELLYVSGWNDGKVLVNPGGFPYINISLDANSMTLHKDQHHTINEVGFDYLIDIIKDAIRKSGDKFDSYFKYEGEVMWNQTPCYKITISNESYKFESYITKEDESLISIARKLKLSEFKIAELNKISDYGPVKPSKVLIIPNSYARTTELLIDKQTWMPVSSKVFDNEGLFEAYDYTNLKLNAVFAADEFNKNFKGYGF